MTYSYCATTGRDRLFFLEMNQLHNRRAYNHHLLLRNKKLPGLWGKPCVVFKNKEREHMLMTLIGDIESLCCLPQIYQLWRLKSDPMSLSFFWISHPAEMMRVIHNIASCLSLYGCGIGKIFIFTFTTRTLMSAPPRVCTQMPVHMHLCTCTAHLLLQNDTQRGKPRGRPHISHLKSWNRIWYSNRNHRYLRPLHLLTDETHCCWDGLI